MIVIVHMRKLLQCKYIVHVLLLPVTCVLHPAGEGSTTLSRITQHLFFLFHLLSLKGMSAQSNIMISKRKCDSPVHAHMMTFNNFSGNNVYNGNKFAEIIYITQCILTHAYRRKLFYQFKLYTPAYTVCCLYIFYI